MMVVVVVVVMVLYHLCHRADTNNIKTLSLSLITRRPTRTAVELMTTEDCCRANVHT